MQKSKLESVHGKCADEKRRYMEQIESLRVRIR